MKISVSIPFASASPETGLILLISNYLRSMSHDIVQCSCDGVFPVSGCGGSLDWKKSMTSCALWMREQREFARWSSIGEAGISDYLSPSDVYETGKWMQMLSTHDLTSASYRGFDVYSRCKHTISEKFGTESPDLSVSENEAFVRDIMLASVRIYLASAAFNAVHRPALSFIAGGKDFATGSFMVQSMRQGIGVVLFQWQLKDRCIKVIHPRSREEYSSDYILEDITNMRADVNTWPTDITEICVEILTFLDIPAEPKKLVAAN